MIGRRIPVAEGLDPYVAIKEPGDYYGPVIGYASREIIENGIKKLVPIPSVFFLLPIARDADVPAHARSLHHVVSPPHKFTEEADGTLTITDSIGAGPGDNYYWHGYLTKGEWMLA